MSEMTWPQVSPAEPQKLFNLFGFVITEEQMIPATSPSDLDLEVFESFLRRLGLELDDEPRLEPVDDLRNRGVVRMEGDEPRLTLYVNGTQAELVNSTDGGFVRLTLRR